MRPIDRACRTCLAMLLVAGLSGCANLEAVRDFTASSARLTDYKAVTERYFASVDHVLAEMPDTPDFTKDRNDTEALRRAQAAQKETLLKLHDTVTGYLAALARLAGDDTFDLSGSIDAVSGKLVLVPNLGIDSTHVDAYASIAKTVTSFGTPTTSPAARRAGRRRRSPAAWSRWRMRRTGWARSASPPPTAGSWA